LLAILLPAISPHISRADDGGGAVVFWVVVGIIWLVSQIASGLRGARAARSRAQAQTQGAQAAPTMAGRPTRTHSIKATARTFPTVASQQPGLADSGTAQIPAAQYMAGAPLGRQADDAERRKVYGDLLAGFGGSAVSPDAPQPPAPPVAAQGTAAIAEAQAPSRGALLADLFGSRGLAFAIVASTIIGSCAGLKREPQEPGGW
jgi:hypothetical protein